MNAIFGSCSAVAAGYAMYAMFASVSLAPTVTAYAQMEAAKGQCVREIARTSNTNCLRAVEEQGRIFSTLAGVGVQ